MLLVGGLLAGGAVTPTLDWGAADPTAVAPGERGASGTQSARASVSGAPGSALDSTGRENARTGEREVLATRSLVTGDRIAVVRDSTGNRSVTAAGGGPVHLVSTPRGQYAIPADADHEAVDRSLFALGALFDDDVLPGGASNRAAETTVATPRSDPTVPVLLHTNATAQTVVDAGFESARRLDSAGVVAAEYDASTPETPLDALRRHASVERVALDERLALQPRDEPPRALFDPNVSETGENVTIAVLDSGIDATHPDLAGQVRERHEIVPSEDRLDPAGHGTSVAGIVAGTGTASDGERAGIAPGAKLIDVRIADEHTYGTVSEVIAGIEYAVTNTDADVLTLSLATVSKSRALAEAIDWAAQQGVVVVTASGNSGAYRSIDQTGARETAITVGATTADPDTVASFSSRGPTGDGRVKPELVAPGANVPTPRAGADESGVPYTRFGGTSAAAPYVAGTVALLLDQDPTLTVEAIERRLASTATPLPDADAFEQGSGRVDPAAALDPAVLVDEPIVDPGVIEPGETVRRAVTFENVDDRRHVLSLDPALAHVRNDDPATESLSLNRSRLVLSPGQSAAVLLTIRAPARSGLYAGAIDYAVDGSERSVALGFVRGGTVTVEKRPLTRGERVDGTPLIVFTPDLTHVESVDFEDGNATFTSAGGTYYFMTGRNDLATGTTVLLYERRQLNGSEHVVLDERDTVRAGVNVAPVADVYGPLANVTVTASLTSPFGGGATRWDTAGENADSRRIRVSPASNVSFARTALLVPEAQQGETPLDAADVFHLGYGTVGIDGARPRVTPWRLVTTEHRYYRESLDEAYTITPKAFVEDIRNSRPPYDFAIGDRATQRIHRLATGIRYQYDFEGADWEATGRPVTDVPRGPRGFRFGVQSRRSVLRHPLSAAVGLDNRSDERVTVVGTPLASAGYLAIDRAGTRATLSARVNDRLVADRRGRWAETRADIPLEPGDNATITLTGEAPGSTLSTNTTTTVSIRGYDPDRPGPPLVDSLSFVDASPANAIRDRARLRIRGVALDRVPAMRVWYAAGAPTEPPWVDESGWIAATTDSAGNSPTATLDLDDPRLDFARHEPTVSVAASLESWDGHRIRTVTTDAAHVGSAPNFDTATVEARVLDQAGAPATGDSILVVDEQRGGIVASDRVGEDGQITVDLRKNRTYTLRQLRGALVDHEEHALDRSRPAVTALDRVTVTGHRNLGTYRLPAANRTQVTVTDQRGETVPNARVTFVHHANDASAQFTAETNANGTVVIDGRAVPGVPLAGDIEIVARPPPDAEARQLAGESANRTVTIDSDTIAPVVLPNRPPEAALDASATATTTGESIVLSAAATTGPAPIERYEWRVTGPGATNRTTTSPFLGLVPTRTGTIEGTVTVVDAFGHRSTAHLSIPVRAQRADRDTGLPPPAPTETGPAIAR
jgi:subtilisin family serine protease